MPAMTGKHALAQMLIAEGVEYIFGNPGASDSPVPWTWQTSPGAWEWPERNWKTSRRLGLL